jgi:N-acetylglucosaminyl-diphospho-decaprenol L-rhamnosyltransferase
MSTNCIPAAAPRCPGIGITAIFGMKIFPVRRPGWSISAISARGRTAEYSKASPPFDAKGRACSLEWLRWAIGSEDFFPEERTAIHASLTIIIVTFNSGHVIERCLASLGEFAASVLVADNGSTDDTLAILRRNGVPVLPLGKNLGFGRAANQGARNASSEYLGFCNPDCQASPEFLKLAVEALAGDPMGCAVPETIRQGEESVAGVQLGYTRNKLLKDMIETNFGPSSLLRRLERMPGLHDPDWHWPLGVCLVLGREFFLRLEGFDPRFFLYCEDVDLGLRITRAGGRIIPVAAELRHDSQNSSRIAFSRKQDLLNRGRLRYARIHYGISFFLLLRSVQALSRGLKRLARSETGR